MYSHKTHFLVYFLLAGLIYACNGDNNTEKNDYSAYHNFVNKAEKNILQSKFDQALTDYQSAFSAVPSSFAIDYFNAAICAIYTEQIEEAFDLATQLVQKGCPLSFFDQTAFAELRGHKEKWQLFQGEYFSNRTIYKSKTDTILRNKIAKLVQSDQSHYCRPNREAHLEAIEDINQYIATELHQTFEEHGFPSEHKVGVHIKQDSIIVVPSYYLLFLHQYQAHNNEWDDLLKKAISMGEMRAKEFAALSSQIDKDAFGNQVFWQMGDFLYEIIKRDYPISTIDKNRTELGMELYADYREKAYFQYIKSPSLHFNFGFQRFFMESTAPPDKILQYILEIGAIVEVCDSFL